MRATPAVYRGSGLCCCHVFMQFMLVSCQAVHSTTPVRCLENELPAQSLPAHRCSRLQTPSSRSWSAGVNSSDSARQRGHLPGKPCRLRCRRRALPRPRVPNLRECRLETKTSTCDKKCASLRLEPRVLLLADRASTAAVRGMTEKTVGSSETLPWLQSPGSDRSPPPTSPFSW